VKLCQKTAYSIKCSKTCSPSQLSCAAMFNWLCISIFFIFAVIFSLTTGAQQDPSLVINYKPLKLTQPYSPRRTLHGI